MLQATTFHRCLPLELTCMHLYSSALYRWRMPFEVDARTLLFTAGACGAVLYSLYWKGQLPESVAKPIGRITFIPQLPFTFVTQTYVRNWWDELIPGSNIYIGGLPIAALGHVDQLYDLGVRGVVNMCDEYYGPVAEYEKRHMKQLYLPTVDHLEPKLDDIKAAVDFISDYQARKEGVYIHCKGGVGRSGAVAFAYLLAAKGWDLETTQAYISSVRSVSRSLYRRPNVIAFFNELRQRK